MKATITESGGSQRVESGYERLKAAIVEGHFRPAEHLAEATLSKMLGVSRNTVRLILSRLTDEGLVESEPYKGKRVVSLSLDMTRQILEAREHFEAVVGGLAASRATPEDLAALNDIVRAMEEALAGESYDTYSQLNGEFHACIATIAGNGVMRQILNDLKTRLVRFQYRTVMIPGRSTESLAEHRAIVAALAAHDPATAEAAMRRHVRHVWDTIVKHQALLDVMAEERSPR